MNLCCQTIYCCMGYFIDWFVSYNAFKFALCGCLWAPADPEKVVFAYKYIFFIKLCIEQGQ